jgi:hypothetical protein
MINSITFLGANEPILPDTPEKPDNPDGDSSVCQHSYGEWSILTPPTETESGSRCRTCSLCGGVQRETIPPLASGDNFGGSASDVISGLTEAGCAATLGCSALLAILPVALLLYKKKEN